MKLEEFARESRATHKGDKSGVPIVGLEHLIPQEIKFSGYDVDTENTFTKTFKKGQILFGRRRAYLKKAAIADFDGICSGDITVIEAIPGKVDPLLLPFIIQNDKFFDYAVSRSAGGLSPRVKWEHLKDYEFDLPPIEEQRILADKLWAAYRLKESYKKLLTATQEMVKSQFIEIFYGMETTPVKDYIDDSFPGEWGTEDKDGNGVKVIRTTNFTNSGKLNLADVVTRSIEDRKVVRKQMLNSTCKCNRILINNLFKFFVWREVSKSFTRSIIEFIFNPLNLFVGYFTKVLTLWDILPDKPVGVFIGTTFP